MNDIELNALVKNTLEDAKALDITEIDVRGMTDVCNTLFICTASSGRHGRSVERKLLDMAKLSHIKSLGADKDGDEAWILIDLGRTVIHIMQTESRRFYNLEQLWDLTTHSREQHAD